MGNRRRAFRPTNNGKEWATDEDKVLRELFAEGSTYTQIGELLQRTRGAVEARVQMWKQVEAHDPEIRDRVANPLKIGEQAIEVDLEAEGEAPMSIDGGMPSLSPWDAVQRLEEVARMVGGVAGRIAACVYGVEIGAPAEARGPGRESLLACPQCLFDCVHLESVMILTHPHSVEITDQGIRLLPAAGAEEPLGSGRGSEVRIRYWGECGHRWTVRQGFHKGSVFVKTEIDDGETQGFIPELWRD